MNRTAKKGRFLPMAALGGVGALGVLLVTFVAVRSKADELLLGATDAAFHYERALHAEGSDEILLNGLGFRVVSGSTGDRLHDVLDRLAARCAGENADVGVALERLRRGPAEARAAVGRLRFDGTLRVERDGRGAVACLGRQSTARNATLAVRLRSFLATGDVAEIGPLRLFFASEGATGTTYVALSSEGPLPLEAAFPKKGDAPGRDPSDLPRPPRADRRLSAWAPGTSASMFVYEVAEPESLLALSRYASALTSAGWAVGARAASSDHLVARSGQHALVASVAPANHGRVLLSIVTL